MLTQPKKSPGWQNLVKLMVASRPGAWFFARTLHHFDRLTLKLSGGKQTLTAILSGLQVVTVTTIGAKSGAPRSVPLIPLPEGDKLVLIASNYGQKSHPSWYYNLRAHPEAQVTYRGKTTYYSVRQADPVEAEAYWKEAAEIYIGYAVYRQRASQRQIGVFVLTPV
jgi:deazaflavin-dependent oxidoreductase (nitroreductase family)